MITEDGLQMTVVETAPLFKMYRHNMVKIFNERVVVFQF